MSNVMASSMVCVPKCVLVLIVHLCLSGMWLEVLPRIDTKETCFFLRDWTTCSKYGYCSKVKIQDDRRDLSDHLISMRIFTSIVNRIFL